MKIKIRKIRTGLICATFTLTAALTGLSLLPGDARAEINYDLSVIETGMVQTVPDGDPSAEIPGQLLQQLRATRALSSEIESALNSGWEHKAAGNADNQENNNEQGRSGS